MVDLGKKRKRQVLMTIHRSLQILRTTAARTTTIIPIERGKNETERENDSDDQKTPTQSALSKVNGLSFRARVSASSSTINRRTGAKWELSRAASRTGEGADGRRAGGA